MRVLQRIVSFILVAFMLLHRIAIPVWADDEFAKCRITVSDGEQRNEYDIIIYQNDIYFPASAYGEITRYSYLEGESKYSYSLGKKNIIMALQG